MKDCDFLHHYVIMSNTNVFPGRTERRPPGGTYTHTVHNNVTTVLHAVFKYLNNTKQNILK